MAEYLIVDGERVLLPPSIAEQGEEAVQAWIAAGCPAPAAPKPEAPAEAAPAAAAPVEHDFNESEG